MAPKLIVYSTPLCAPCEALKRILNTEGLDFEVIDLMMDEEAALLMEREGIRTSPALSIDGRLHAGADLEMGNLAALLDL